MVYFHVAVIWKEKKSFRVAKGYRCFLCDLKFNAYFDACDIFDGKKEVLCKQHTRDIDASCSVV